MILVAFGGNLAHERYGPPKSVMKAAAEALVSPELRISSVSRLYDSIPVPASEQPNFVNAVVTVSTSLAPEALLRHLHSVEAAFGRRRRTRNEARTLDLDLLAYDDLVSDGPDMVLPHPRLHERAFVLLPLKDVAPDWRHPRLGRSVDELIAALPAAAVQGTRAIEDSWRP